VAARAAAKAKTTWPVYPGHVDYNEWMNGRYRVETLNQDRAA